MRYGYGGRLERCAKLPATFEGGTADERDALEKTFTGTSTLTEAIKRRVVDIRTTLHVHVPKVLANPQVFPVQDDLQPEDPGQCQSVIYGEVQVSLWRSDPSIGESLHARRHMQHSASI